MQGATRSEWQALYKGRCVAMSTQTHSRRASRIEKTIALIRAKDWHAWSWFFDKVPGFAFAALGSGCVPAGQRQLLCSVAAVRCGGTMRTPDRTIESMLRTTRVRLQLLTREMLYHCKMIETHLPPALDRHDSEIVDLKRASPTLLDRLGIAVSAFCMVQCLALPLTLMFAPLASWGVLSHDLFHLVLLAVIVPVSSLAFLFG
ncbi:MAG: MerC domain-containing protein, partial [Gammaproteobacteria bacterium]|nr:MerC domain-containing protein [Gammaproteobacteria bacterium]